MGWASATPIFTRTTRKLVELRAPDRVVTAVCAELIAELCDGDWDTLDEAIEQFKDNRAVMAAFQLAAPEWLEPEEE